MIDVTASLARHRLARARESLHDGDVLVLWGTPEDLEQEESRLLMG